MNKKELVLIIGSCGNIGKSILKHELKNKKEIISVDLKNLDSEFKQKDIIHCKLNLAEHKNMEKLDEIIKERKKNLKSVILASALDSIPTDQNKSIQSYTKGIEFANLEEIQKRINVNIASQLFVIKTIYKYLDMKSHILLFSSIYGIRSPDHRIYGRNFIKPIEYSTSKSAIIGLTKHLSVTLALENKGRANCLILGGLKNNQQDKYFQENYINKVPLNRMLEKEDILNGYDFLISSRSSYITGSSLVIDGGYTSW